MNAHQRAPVRNIALRSLPNAISLARVTAVGVAAFTPQSWTYFSPLPTLVIFLLIYWVSDILDGALARSLRVASRHGENVDLFADRCCDLLLSVAVITTASGINLWAASAFLVLRFSPDFLVGRTQGESERAYIDLFGCGSLLRAYPFARRIGLEIVHLIRAFFFASALIPGMAISWMWLPFLAVGVGFCLLAWISILSMKPPESMRNNSAS